MRKNVRLLAAALLAALALFAWNDNAHTQERLVALYTQAFDSLVNWDQVEAAGLQYIAIDATKLGGLDDASVEEVLTYFRKKYGVETLSASLQGLRSQGLARTEGLTHGILFRVDEARVWLSRVASVEVSEYEGNLGAQGERFVAWFLFGRWTLMPRGGWIS